MARPKKEQVYLPKCPKCKGTRGAGCKASNHSRSDWDGAMQRYGKDPRESGMRYQSPQDALKGVANEENKPEVFAKDVRVGRRANRAVSRRSKGTPVTRRRRPRRVAGADKLASAWGWKDYEIGNLEGGNKRAKR